ncbi:glycosyltransferase family 2 protein [Cyanobium sp. Morenito 9A2]|uniref:glycosyltransferase family 2 protein n=1 Tax=Cyanobium sp. Morenito 9A2 TaxID=2823718 RepID=UPI0020CC1AE0|nr:glycosyltransferase family 2 protein [Cyanobium sp. Morenito 9A2]MCP9849797.1 glycosyltransferase family 2 protein [Cyanobium sp. Morenito 9A2]
MADPLAQLTPLILTYNEEPNIARTLTGLSWAQRIVVIDSGSSDRTLAILAAHPQVEVVHRMFDSFAAQCNFGLTQIHTPWVLSLDADYGLSPALVDEIRAALAGVPAEMRGFRIPFRYCVDGKPLRGTILPPRLALYRLGSGHYVNDGHAHRYELQGASASLSHPIFHDDRKPLSRWLRSQERYLQQEASKLLSTPHHQLSRADRLRKRHVIAPFAVLFLCLVLKGGLLDGSRGWFYAFQRMYAELLLSLMLWEGRM